MTMLDAAAPAISRLLTDKPGETPNNLFQFFLATIGDEEEVAGEIRASFIEATTPLVHRIIDSTLWPQAAEAVTHGNTRSWQGVHILAHWLHNHDPAAYAEFVSHIDLNYLDTSTSALWEKLESLHPLLIALSCAPDREPGRSWIVAHADEINTMPAWAIAISPETASTLNNKGQHLSLDLSGAFWGRAAEALQALADVDRPAAASLLQRSRTELTQALSSSQFYSSEGLAMFLQVADACDTHATNSAFAALDPAVVEESWPTLLEGTQHQRVPGAVGDAARQLSSQIPPPDGSAASAPA
ncbi:hypothetical protein ACIQJ4_35505 [Streptomyces filamentosus]|uniref:hypothetical protein n=1 Tax=Streptomyces filamentosus TaxID=67294 RepID=UPI0038154FAF